jgi:hypothetical protein
MSEENISKKTHTDPALIPTAIYNAEGKTVHANNMFVSSEMLNKMLPMDTRDELVEKMNELAEIVNNARDQITNQIDRRSIAVGKGFRNYGFMMASNQSMNNFPELAPNFVNTNDFNDVIEDYLFARDISERMFSISNDMRDIMNIFGNIGFSFALAYYSNVRSIAERTRDKTAVSVFQILQRFFTRKRTPKNEDEPTEHQLERDFHALLHGHKDGEIVIKNTSPNPSEGGEHVVVDETHKASGYDHKASGHAHLVVKENEVINS